MVIGLLSDRIREPETSNAWQKNPGNTWSAKRTESRNLGNVVNT
jgi:hypothetical protein